MVTPENAFLSLLETATGEAAGIKVYASQAPQGATRPYAVYRLVSMVGDYHMLNCVGLAGTRIQLDIYADSAKQASAVAEAFRQAVDAYRGTVTVGADTLKIERIRRDNSAASLVEPLAGEGLGVHRRTCDYLMRHAETVPTR